MDLPFLLFICKISNSSHGPGTLALHQGLLRELHHRLRLGHLSCTLKSRPQAKKLAGQI